MKQDDVVEGTDCASCPRGDQSGMSDCCRDRGTLITCVGCGDAITDRDYCTDNDGVVGCPACFTEDGSGECWNKAKAALSAQPTSDLAGELADFAWAFTPDTGEGWNQYPPFLNLSVRDGKLRVHARSPERKRADDGVVLPGDWTEFDLPIEALVELKAALSIRPASALADRATEILAGLYEIAGNKAAAFSLRQVGAVGSQLEDQHTFLLNQLTALQDSNATQHSDLAEQDFKHQVRGAMIDAWNEICSDTGCHPVDIKREGSKLFYTPMHWTDAAASILFERLTALRSNRAAIREECARLAEQSSAPECHVLAKHIRSLNGGDHD